MARVGAERAQIVAVRLPDGVEIANVQKAEADFLIFMESSHAQLVSDIEEKKELTADITERLTAAVEGFKKTLAKSEVPAEATS